MKKFDRKIPESRDYSCQDLAVEVVRGLRELWQWIEGVLHA